MLVLRLVIYVWGLGNVALALLFLRTSFWVRLVEKVSLIWIFGLLYLGPIAMIVILYQLLLSDRSGPVEGILEEKLQSAEIFVSFICAIAAIGGLLLFILGGHRIDLYILCVASAKI